MKNFVKCVTYCEKAFFLVAPEGEAGKSLPTVSSNCCSNICRAFGSNALAGVGGNGAIQTDVAKEGMYGFAFQGEGVGGMTGRDDRKVPLANGVVIAKE